MKDLETKLSNEKKIILEAESYRNSFHLLLLTFLMKDNLNFFANRVNF